jgi:hypothetical protein
VESAPHVQRGPTSTISMGVVLCSMEEAHHTAAPCGKAGSGEVGVGVGGERLELEAEAR